MTRHRAAWTSLVPQRRAGRISLAGSGPRDQDFPGQHSAVLPRDSGAARQFGGEFPGPRIG